MRTLNDIKIGSPVWAITYKNGSNKMEKTQFNVIGLNFESNNFLVTVKNLKNYQEITAGVNLFNGNFRDKMNNMSLVETLPIRAHKETRLAIPTLFLNLEELNVEYNKLKVKRAIDIDKALLNYPVVGKYHDIVPPQLEIKFNTATIQNNLIVMFDDLTYKKYPIGEIKYVYDGRLSISPRYNTHGVIEAPSKAKSFYTTFYGRNCLIAIEDPNKAILKIMMAQIIQRVSKERKLLNKYIK